MSSTNVEAETMRPFFLLLPADSTHPVNGKTGKTRGLPENIYHPCISLLWRGFDHRIGGFIH